MFARVYTLRTCMCIILLFRCFIVLCACICMDKPKCIQFLVHVHIHKRVCARVFVSVRVRECNSYTCMHVCVCMRMCEYACAHVCVHVCVCACVCMCMFVDIRMLHGDDIASGPTRTTAQEMETIGNCLETGSMSAKVQRRLAAMVTVSEERLRRTHLEVSLH